MEAGCSREVGDHKPDVAQPEARGGGLPVGEAMCVTVDARHQCRRVALRERECEVAPPPAHVEDVPRRWLP